jgi:biotin operon repressor
LNQTLNDTGQSALDAGQSVLFAKRSLEAVSEEARKFADNYRRIQQVMQEVSILFTPQGLGATWAPFQEFFRAFRQTTFLPPEVRRGLEEAGVLERRRTGIGGIFARGQQPTIIRPEEALEFRIPRLQPIPVGFAEWAGVQIQAALREIDARMTHLAATLATFNQEMMRIGYTINTSVIQAYQQLAQAFRNLVTQMENINRQTQEMIRGLRQAYEITETWLRLRWGLEDLRTAGAYLTNIVTASERLLTITRLRAEAQLIEVQRAAAMLGIITAMVRQQIASLRRAGVDIGIEPEQFDPLRMAPAQIAQIMQEARMPYFLINLTVQLTQGLQEGWVAMIEVFRRGGEEIANAASSFRQLQGEITEAAVRFGDMRTALQAGIYTLISFGEELRGLGLKLTAALASNRIEEYYRVLQEGWRRFVEMFEKSIDVIRRGFEAAFQPLNIYLDILERASKILERFGAQGLILPEIFIKVIPEASRLLRLLEEMAQQYREHPYMLQMIFQVYETQLNRLMGLLGQAAGGLVPAIPLSELIRISQLPILDPRQVARWAREGGPEVFAPEVRIMGVPFTPTYLLAWPVHMRGPTYLAAGPFGELARSVVGMGRLAAELETEEIRRQIGEIYRQFILLPLRRWEEEATQRERFLGGRLPLVIQQTYEQNVLGARAGLMRERVPLPGFEGVAPYQPTLAIPPQAMEVPVRLRIQLDNNVIPLQIQIRKPDGGYETIERRIEITPLDIARRSPPTTGTQ